EHAVFVDAQRSMRRRNIAAMLLAIKSPPLGIQVPQPNLALSAFAPTITVTGAQGAPPQERARFIDATKLQPRRNIAAQYLAITSAPGAGNAISIPTSILNLNAYAPTVLQASPVFYGQDLQQFGPEEVWQPKRPIHLAALRPPGTVSVNVNLSTL